MTQNHHQTPMKRILHISFALAIVALSAASCVTSRKISYLQDMKHESQIELENKFEAVISPYDELEVIISSFDSELAKPFNIYSAAEGAIRNGNQEIGYLVDQNGNIQLPVLGEVHASGYTRLQLQEIIKNLLVEGGYINDPYVMVRFKNFKIFFLGADGGKAINITNERCTFLEALALGGDLSVYTKRNKIAVMRQIDGVMVTRYLDPRSSDVFNDPFFMMQQNDFIITKASGHKNFLDSFEQWSPFFTVFSGLTSLATLFVMYQIYSR